VSTIVGRRAQAEGACFELIDQSKCEGPEPRRDAPQVLGTETVQERPTDEVLGVIGLPCDLLHSGEATDQHGVGGTVTREERGDEVRKLAERSRRSGVAVSRFDQVSEAFNELGNRFEHGGDVGVDDGCKVMGRYDNQSRYRAMHEGASRRRGLSIWRTQHFRGSA